MNKINMVWKSEFIRHEIFYDKMKIPIVEGIKMVEEFNFIFICLQHKPLYEHSFHWNA